VIRLLAIWLIASIVVGIALGKAIGAQWGNDLAHDLDVWSRPFPS